MSSHSPQHDDVPAARPLPGATRRRPPTGVRRAGLFLAVAAAGALTVNLVVGGEPAAQAEPPLESVGIAQQLGIPAQPTAELSAVEAVRPLEALAASRSEREAQQTAAAQAQAAADQAELDRRAAEEAARKAAEEAARKAAEEEAARKAAAEAEARAAAEAKAAAKTAAPVAAKPAAGGAAASRGSFRDYALAKLGGDAKQFSCLENLWGKESGWNPNAQNPRSSAYGIPQFLDSTWASTGIAKTSDGYRQIDAGLIYIEKRYGSPCAAWSHSQAKNWY